ncbi:hypothetical protein B0H14DRAFT_3773850 [Mycena olivaceomarginata]|nr:hypothetical protein B0H14DRAFT_3773850 [Mycena olivaceomarginata]
MAPWELFEKKGRNITVILDSCHSGGMGRIPEPDVRAALLESRSVPPDLDSHLWDRKDKTDTVMSYRMWSPSAESHVLLAACRAEEMAREFDYPGEYSGRFTTNLVSLCELMQRMPLCTKQTLHGGGSRMKRLIFSGNYPKTGRRAVPLISMVFRVDMGAAEGVVPGTDFSTYDPQHDLCTFVVQSVLVDHSILVTTPSSAS